MVDMYALVVQATQASSAVSGRNYPSLLGQSLSSLLAMLRRRRYVNNLKNASHRKPKHYGVNPAFRNTPAVAGVAGGVSDRTICAGETPRRDMVKSGGGGDGL